MAVARLLDLPDPLSTAQSVPAAASAAAGRAVLVPSHTVVAASSDGCYWRHRKIEGHEAVSAVAGRRDRQNQVGIEKRKMEGPCQADCTAAGHTAAGGGAAAAVGIAVAGSGKEASGLWADRTYCSRAAPAAAAAEREDRTLSRKVEGTAAATGTNDRSTLRLKGEVQDRAATSRAVASDHTPALLLPPTCGRSH